MVNFPTKNENALDIFCSNRSSLVQRCETIPGLSNHDIVLVHTTILLTKRKSTQRLVYLEISQPSRHVLCAENSTSTSADNLSSSFKRIYLPHDHQQARAIKDDFHKIQPAMIRKSFAG